MAPEAYVRCRVHKNCVDAHCEFKRLSWELRAARDRADARGRAARVSDDAWARAAMREDEAWMVKAREERTRRRAALAKENRQMELAARTALTQREERRERAKTREGGVEASGSGREREKKPAIPLTEAERTRRRAMEICEERVNRIGHVMKRRALILARGPSVEVDPVTSKVIKALNAKELQVALRRDAKKQNLLDRVRRARASLVPLKGPDLGNMYRCPILYEELWLYEDEDAEEPTRADLIHMSVAM